MSAILQFRLKFITKFILFGAAASVFVSACSGGSDSDQFEFQDEESVSVESGQFLDVSAVAEAAESGSTNMLDASDFTPFGDEGDVMFAPDTGDLIPMIFESRTAVDPDFVRSSAALVERLNESLALPADINVRFTDCGEANAFYAPPLGNENNEAVAAGGAIFICHELADLFSNFFADSEQAFAANVFVIMHELGHALVNQLELPVLGIEESYVDGIAAVFLGESGLSEGSVLAGWFFANQGQSPFFDTHRAGPQRLGDLACWGVGADPELLNDPVINSISQQLFLAGRRCTDEYNQQLSGLQSVLGDNIRGGLTDLIALPLE